MNLARLFNTICKLPKIERIDLDSIYYKLIATDLRILIGHRKDGVINTQWAYNIEYNRRHYKR
jgi:hypothetical protein